LQRCISAGQARSLQNDGAQELLTSEIDLSSLVSDQEVGETSMYAANSAAVNIASLLEEPMWDGVQGGPKCCVKCNGKVCHPLHCINMLQIRLLYCW